MKKFKVSATVCESYKVDFTKNVEVEVEAEDEEAAEIVAERAFLDIKSDAETALAGMGPTRLDYWLEDLQIKEGGK